MLIIDVFNVLHAAPKASPEMGMLSVERLAGLIENSRFGGEPAWLVCDGTAGGGMTRGLAERAGTELVQVLFAGPGKDADGLIERLLDRLEEQKRLGGVVVVSGDRRVQAAATGVRVRWMGSDAFVRALADDLRRLAHNARQKTGGRPEFAARERLDPEAAKAWLREFGIQDGACVNSAPSVPAEPSREVEAVDDAGGAAPEEDRGRLLDGATLKELEEWAKSLDRTLGEG